ncbi:MAG: hypothetical protein ABWX66_01630 [Lacisediminihabitans sp.]
MTLTLDSTASQLFAVPAPLPLMLTARIPHADREIADGRLIRARRGIVTPAHLSSALKPWERYTARVHAVSMTHPGAVFCLESAAAAIGLPVFGEPRDIHVLDTPGATSRLSGGVRLHTTAGDRVITDLGGVLVTSVRDTAIDIARHRHGALALAVADRALRLDPNLTVEVLVAHNESRISKRGRRLARWPLHRATPLAESPLESVSRAAIEWLGFDEPELQKEFRSDGAVDRCDMWWERARVLGEADGDLKYDGSLQPSADAIRKEKNRDRRLRSHASAVTHWGWADVVQVTPLRAALRHAGLRQRTTESSLELHTLSSLLAHPTRRTP